MRRPYFFLTLALALAPLQYAQETVPDATASAVPVERLLSRWFDVNALSFSMRYRNSADLNGLHLFEFGQEKSLVDGRLKLDHRGKYSINFHISSGRSFNWSYSDEIGGAFTDVVWYETYRGTQQFQTAGLAAQAADSADVHLFARLLASRGWRMSTRQLYFKAAPVKQVAFEYGSLPIEHGMATEITTYDDDGYVAGGRVHAYDSKHLFFDELSATFGYSGDILLPSFFDRTDRLSQSNYHQFLAAKSFKHRVKASTDFTRDKQTHIFREAALVQTPETRVVDNVRAELYQRVNDVTLQGERFASGSGFALTAGKTIRRTFQLEGGYADVDGSYGVTTGSRAYTVFGFSLNGDSFNTGQRVFARANYKATSFISIFGFYTSIVKRQDYTVARQSMNFGATIDLQNLLGEKLHLF